MELERILQQQGFGSRKDCRSLIRSGRVSLGDSPCFDPFIDVDPHSLTFTVDGIRWQSHVSANLLLHKPVGYECSRQPRHYPSIFTLLPQPLITRGVQPVGRLDADTSGLLLLTDNGQLNHRLCSPRHRVPKHYQVTLKHAAAPELLETLLGGVLLHDETLPVCAHACRLAGSHQLDLSICEGKYHQVKRMVAAAGNRVEALHRKGIGSLTLPDDLSPGNWRWLSDCELALLET